MAYTIKPSIGMLPIADISKTMSAQGFIKDITPSKIEKVTAIKDPVTGQIKTPGIKDPSRIAVCAGIFNEHGVLDRETIKNSLMLNGRPASQYLVAQDKELINTVMNKINRVHSDEVQLLRDEIYHLKAELVRTGHIEDTGVANGYIDGFKKSNIKYDIKTTKVKGITNKGITQSEKIFKKDDWLVVRKNRSDIHSNEVANIVSESGNDIKLNIGTGNIVPEQTMLMKTLGGYNRGTFSFSEVSYGTPGAKENYTMLNDDSNISKLAIKTSNTGYAAVLKIPKRCAGFLTKFTVNGVPVGNPGPLSCQVIKGDYEYINRLSKSPDAIAQAKADGTYIAKSSTVNASEVSNQEIIFDFTRLDFNPDDSLSTLYPEIEGEYHCFIIEADNVTDHDFWNIEFGHKRNANYDLQTNNITYRFYNKALLSTSNNALEEIKDIDMLYVVNTRPKEKEDEIPYSTGLYTTLNPIKMPKPITASRARLTLEVNKEGNFVVSSHGVINAETDTIEFRKADGTYAEQTVIGGGDNLIIGSSIVKAKSSGPNFVTIDRSTYVEPMMPIYRCGYKAQLKTCLIEEDGSSKVPVIKAGSERVYPLELVAVIPSGRNAQAHVSDRLIFEVDFENVKDKYGKVVYFNNAELQIKWSSPLNSSIIHTQAQKGNDYVGRIHSMSLAFDKTI